MILRVSSFDGLGTFWSPLVSKGIVISDPEWPSQVTSALCKSKNSTECFISVPYGSSGHQRVNSKIITLLILTAALDKWITDIPMPRLDENLRDMTDERRTGTMSSSWRALVDESRASFSPKSFCRCVGDDIRLRDLNTQLHHTIHYNTRIRTGLLASS